MLCNHLTHFLSYLHVLILQIKRLPGIDYNKQEQLRQFEILRRQLHLKRELLQKYRNMCSFDAPFK